MKTYRYIELQDYFPGQGRNTGRLFFVGKPTTELLEELEAEIEPTKKGYYDPKPYTTLMKMAKLGWELKFVSPTGFEAESHKDRGGQIVKSYIFAKEYMTIGI